MNCCETIKKLKSVPTDKWYSVVNKAGVNLSEMIKELIDSGEYNFELSSDYQRFRRLYDPFLDS